jgi:perosamine synthetase
MIPYARHAVSEQDIEAVVAALRSDWLTTGPRVAAFESQFAARVQSAHAVALSSGTAGLHAAMQALGIAPGDEVIVPAITFVASANAVVFMGATPVFADVETDTALLDAEAAAACITPRTKALLAVDFAGQTCDYRRLRRLAESHGLALVADACHSLGADYAGQPAGSVADLSVFSFHPVKPITCAEGGMVTTADAALAKALRRFRNHGIDTDFRQREAAGTWEYDMLELGFNYRLSDLQCALGISQLSRLEAFLARRRAIAARYDAAFAALPTVQPLRTRAGSGHAYHLYVVRVSGVRADWFARLRALGIGVNVHYRPVYLHSFYRQRFATAPGLCPVAETLYERLLSLPLYPAMPDAEVEAVISAVAQVASELA